MSIELVKKYAPYVDEMFREESKSSVLTNTDFDWTGAHSVSVWKISTVGLNDYTRNKYDDSLDDGSVESISRFGKLYDLNAQTEEMLLKNDKSFIFNIDKLDQDETGETLNGATALAREVREVVIPTVDTYTYGVITSKAGTVAEASELTAANIYDCILEGTKVLDDNEVPETERAIVVNPEIYKIMKKAGIFDNTEIGSEIKRKGVVAEIDGMLVIKVPSNRLPENFGFLIAHPSATTAPIKLEDYGLHEDTPLSSGTIVTGRICYDAFVLENKAKGIYYQPIA